jgi:hypothetical protein
MPMSITAAAVPKSQFGYMKDTVMIKRDIVAPIDESWSAVSGVEDHFYAGARKKPRARRAVPKK